MQNAKIEERQSDLDTRRKNLDDLNKKYQDEEAKRNALHTRRTTRERLDEEFTRSKNLVCNKITTRIKGLGLLTRQNMHKL